MSHEEEYSSPSSEKHTLHMQHFFYTKLTLITLPDLGSRARPYRLNQGYELLVPAENQPRKPLPAWLSGFGSDASCLYILLLKSWNFRFSFQISSTQLQCLFTKELMVHLKWRQHVYSSANSPGCDYCCQGKEILKYKREMSLPRKFHHTAAICYRRLLRPSHYTQWGLHLKNRLAHTILIKACDYFNRIAIHFAFPAFPLHQ